MLAGNIPGRTETIPVAIFFAIEAGDNHEALGWAALVLVISLAVLAAMGAWTRHQRSYLARGFGAPLHASSETTAQTKDA